MTAAGIRLTLLVGARVPTPAPPWLIEALDSVEVSHDDEGPSGFQLQFRVGRRGEGARGSLRDYAVLSSPKLETNNRVILVLRFGARRRVLMDGLITHQQLSPGGEPGAASTLTVTGEDLTRVMDLEDRQVEHPQQGELTIAAKIIARYARYGLIPKLVPPRVREVPTASDRVPVQSGTDLSYLREMAGRHGFVFYLTPGPEPFTNGAYFGPPIRFGAPQHALTVDMGHLTNVESIYFENDATLPTLVAGRVQDRKTNRAMPVRTAASKRLPLAKKSVLTSQRQSVRKVPFRESGLAAAQARGRAQRDTDTSMDRVVTVTGELDTSRYGHLLQARSLVGLRGVGLRHDGLYYVKSVHHTLRVGAYTQSFRLTREGVGTTVPRVLP